MEGIVKKCIATDGQAETRVVVDLGETTTRRLIVGMIVASCYESSRYRHMSDASILQMALTMADEILKR